MPRKRLPPRPTLDQIRKQSCWVPLYCEQWGCQHHAPMALTPAIIRWGSDASSDMLRQRTRCSNCGHKGRVTIQGPSWCGEHPGWAPLAPHDPTRADQAQDGAATKWFERRLPRRQREGVLSADDGELAGRRANGALVDPGNPRARLVWNMHRFELS